MAKDSELIFRVLRGLSVIAAIGFLVAIAVPGYIRATESDALRSHTQWGLAEHIRTRTLKNGAPPPHTFIKLDSGEVIPTLIDPRAEKFTKNAQSVIYFVDDGKWCLLWLYEKWDKMPRAQADYEALTCDLLAELTDDDKLTTNTMPRLVISQDMWEDMRKVLGPRD